MVDAPFQPASLAAWCLLAILLGLKHGLEADHLATIDALTRLQPARRRSASGLWFALGHGVVVALVAVTAAALPIAARLPAAAALLMALASALLLIGLGTANLASVLSARVRPSPAPHDRRVARLVAMSPAWAPAAAGALLAVSADTLAIAALFGTAGSGHALPAPLATALMAGGFVAGMALVDGLDGWWLARLLARADERAARAARTMGWAVALLGVTMGSLMLCRLAWPWLDERLEGATWLLSAAAVLVIACAYGWALRVARQRADPLPHPT